MRYSWEWEGRVEWASYCYACERTLEQVGKLEEAPAAVGQAPGVMVCPDCLDDINYMIGEETTA